MLILSNTQIEEMQEFTVVHCTSLTEVCLPKTLHTIREKTFMNCAALPTCFPTLSTQQVELNLGLHCFQEASQVARPAQMARGSC